MGKQRLINTVLIVAKCIVNTNISYFITKIFKVLIVAKCIVNVTVGGTYESQFGVLIVAKCIVKTGYSLIF